MIDLASLTARIREWDDPSDGEAQKSRELILLLIAETERPLSRNQYAPGHMTGTACVIHPSAQAVLLVHHRKLDRWLLPGGHVEEGIDIHVADTARREAQEETGVDLAIDGPAELVGMDVHGIPGRRREPYHLHHDLIFRFQAASALLDGSAEVRDVRWCGLAEFERYSVPIPIRRAFLRSISR